MKNWNFKCAKAKLSIYVCVGRVKIKKKKNIEKNFEFKYFARKSKLNIFEAKKKMILKLKLKLFFSNFVFKKLNVFFFKTCFSKLIFENTFNW